MIEVESYCIQQQWSHQPH